MLELTIKNNMTEKRADYRKRQKKSVINKVKSAFSDNHSNEDVNINPEFQKSESERRHSLPGDGQEFYQEEFENSTNLREEKALKLKKRLNRAILIVFVLIILVLVALFHL